MSTAFVTKAEATFRFGFVGDAKDIAKKRRQGVPLPEGFKPAVRTASGEIVVAKAGERYHAEILDRVSETVDAEGFVYEVAR